MQAPLPPPSARRPRRFVWNRFLRGPEQDPTWARPALLGLLAADGGSSTSSEIAAWVEQSFAATTIDGVTVYDLTEGRVLGAARHVTSPSRTTGRRQRVEALL
jgi:hypothetical protein